MIPIGIGYDSGNEKPVDRKFKKGLVLRPSGRNASSILGSLDSALIVCLLETMAEVGI